MEEKVFRRVAVATELQHYVEARLHVDTGDAEQRARFVAMQERFAGNALPAYVAINPATGVRLGQFVGATLGDDTPFIDFLHEARRDRDRPGEDVLEWARAPR